jgi:hypothetical protein
LHTAPIGAGNSGGPLFDLCGRAGRQQFRTVSDNSTDLAFYFAISMRELAAFLRQARWKPTSAAALHLDRRPRPRRKRTRRQRSGPPGRRCRSQEPPPRRKRWKKRVAMRKSPFFRNATTAWRWRLAAGGGALAGGSALLFAQRNEARNVRIAGGTGACCCWPRS